MAPARVGRPSKYRPEYNDKLVEHMKRGLSFESFGADVGVSKDTLYNWLKRHAAFSDARKRGMPLLELFYVQTGLRIATGQMRRLSSEEPILDAQGKPLRDPKTGEPLMRRQYVQANCNAAAWIFLTKNMLGWRDVRDVNVGGQDGNPVKVRETTREERLERIKKLAAMREACGDD